VTRTNSAYLIKIQYLYHLRDSDVCGFPTRLVQLNADYAHGISHPVGKSMGSNSDCVDVGPLGLEEA
jgi:hypothetical protein